MGIKRVVTSFRACLVERAFTNTEISVAAAHNRIAASDWGWLYDRSMPQEQSVIGWDRETFIAMCRDLSNGLVLQPQGTARPIALSNNRPSARYSITFKKQSGETLSIRAIVAHNRGKETLGIGRLPVDLAFATYESPEKALDALLGAMERHGVSQLMDAHDMLVCNAETIDFGRKIAQYEQRPVTKHDVWKRMGGF